MDATALYNIAKRYVDQIKHDKPVIAVESGQSLCLALTEDEQVFSGITGIGIHDGDIVAYPAECVALIAMFTAGNFKIKQLIIVSMDDYSISVPCIECLNMVMHLDPANDSCEAVISEEKFVKVSELLEDAISDNSVYYSYEDPAEDTDNVSADVSSAPVDFFSGFGDSDDVPEGGAADLSAVFQNGFDESYSGPQHAPVAKKSEENSSLGAPAEFASSVSIDESNPFYAPPTEASDTAASSEPAKSKKSNLETGAPSGQSSKPLSKGELLKQAKQRKKIAKANFNFFKNKS